MVWVTQTYSFRVELVKNQFRKKYSKIGNTREQLFHVWRWFHFDVNTDTLDAYVTHIRQVAALLGYCKPQVLEFFKYTLTMRLYWVLFSIEDSRLAVETATIILAKEKIDRQLAGQSSSMPFMNVRDVHNSKKVVTFNMLDNLDDKIDKLTSLINKLKAQGNNQNKPFQLNLIKAKWEDKQDIIIIMIIIWIDTEQIVE